ncbi:midasin [Naviculisporaceae sp. PSN 640]
MATIDVSRQRASLLKDAALLSNLPDELRLVIQDHQTTTANSNNILDIIANAALEASATDEIFAHFRRIFADISARWILSSPTFDIRVLAAFARILPFAPSLSVFLTRHLQGGPGVEHQSEFGGSLGGRKPLEAVDLAIFHDDKNLLVVLVALWRLNNFDRRTFSVLARPSQLQSLFTMHQNAVIRYLAIRIFCQLHAASDLKVEALLGKHIEKGTSLVAELDGREADYAFLSLYEDSRSREMEARKSRIQEANSAAAGSQANGAPPPPLMQNLTPLVVKYGKTVLPRPLGPVNTPSSLALTPTTVENLENLGRLLQSPGPILLHGLSGSGKTSLVHEIARELGKQEDMVTLHLNEQTDAKMLLGLYTTDSKPGSFQWRPGVLTTAVLEGRFILIEDIDRAPTEVMSTLLPLVERGELLLPGRGDKIQAAPGFRMFATVRTLLGMNDKESLPNLVGMRLWQLLRVKALPHADLRDVIGGRYPLLQHYIDSILAVFDSLLASTSGSTRLALGRMVIDRPYGTRDLLKWCGRLDGILRASGCKTGREPITDTTRDRMFLEAVDCFVGGVHEPSIRKSLIKVISKEMVVSDDRVEHYQTNYAPELEDNETRLTVGRASFIKARRSTRLAKSKRPFATTTHAKRLLEQISVAVKHREPLLLVGETGIGKTTVVQQLAESLGHNLVAVNLSQQSEAGDLLGGFKPVNSQSLAMPIKEELEELFEKTGVSLEKNKEYLDRINKKFAKGRWREVSKEWRKAPKMFEAILAQLEEKEKARAQEVEAASSAATDGQPAKRRKTESSKLARLRDLKTRWNAFSEALDQFDRQIAAGPGGFAFAFVEGKIVKALKTGSWILLDEINLAGSDTLEAIAGLFSATPSLLLSETGSVERIHAHPNFRVFGAMNPATDVGKRDLPLGLRSRFTELYVSSPDRDKKDLLTIIKTYLRGNNSTIDRISEEVAQLYLETKKLAEEKKIVDQANEVPHYSLRTLTRTLTYANDVAPFYGLDRAMYEGFCMCFCTLLSEDSEQLVNPLIKKHLLRSSTILTTPPKRPQDGRNYVSFKSSSKSQQYWLLQGKETPVERDDYIITPYVERNLLNLVRATATRRYPVLIQGPTSAGKTSLIEYLANITGNKFVRINNHEGTDIQEYLGTYVSDSEGKLKFQEGVLVQAMREGSWLVLDELNLCGSEILESLNRLLDDNRELLIPETQEIVRPAEGFCLFATQNPAGLYGGRKVLSRAFRNRFLELHFDDIPESELETILQKRSRNTAPSDCRRIVSVYKSLTRLRQESRVFEQKNSFATLRDLFRWALRECDTRQEIADNGFMLLAERVRKPEERDEVRKVIEEVFKVKIDPDLLYRMDAPEFVGGPNSNPVDVRSNSQGVIWTKAMRRLYVLVKRAVMNNEPVLLVGETGCGKTTVCQLLAEFEKKELHIVNAHQNTETGDLIGSQRPVRNRGAILEGLVKELKEAAGILGQSVTGSPEELQTWYAALGQDQLALLPEELKARIHASITRSRALFEWSDGSLVHAMKEGAYFLLDEVSLAEDAVLERLNSVLEPHRSLLLAEKGVDNSFVVASEGFQFFATMNPGGDFGKRELSPALRNRFTEIWVPALSEVDDVHDIVVSKLDARFHAATGKENGRNKSMPISRIIVEFSAWFGKTFRSGSSTEFSVRDILGWVQFMNECHHLEPEIALLNGAAMVYIDTIGANPSALIAVDPRTMKEQRLLCLEELSRLCGVDLKPAYFSEPQVVVEENKLTIGGFSIERVPTENLGSGDEFNVPTTKMNAMRVIRALQGTKPILLEGNPGVGKTTLVTALARACGRPLTRINLSDQTDVLDLFGTDVPMEGAEAGNFCWQNAPFLEAMIRGEWCLLDELNLASPQLLECLNACLDHRGEVYIAELDQVFKRHPDFRLFAAQNPHHQGGGRKGLPASFVNRFILAYTDVFTKEDLLCITAKKFEKIGDETQHQMIEFMSRLDDAVVSERRFGSLGSPWEFNLRDTLRWCDLMTSTDALLANRRPDDYLDVVIRQRFRTERDRQEVNRLFYDIFGRHCQNHDLYHDINPLTAQVGLASLKRNGLSQPTPFPNIDVVPRLKEIESIIIAVEQDLPCILVGPSGSGKSALLAHVAAMAGKELVIFPLNADVDTMDLIGGFEQADPYRDVQACLAKLQEALQIWVLSVLPGQVAGGVVDLLAALKTQAGESKYYPALLKMVEGLQTDESLSEELADLVSEAARLLNSPLKIDHPRFEWLDGVIVRAVQAGSWLVLDNANLCSASVLDRLNSLLERPNGILSINEHSDPGGQPRVLVPHPDFRIFLTCDPRYGELSRAMRNRSVEIFLESLPWDKPAVTIAPVEGSLQRYHTATQIINRHATANEAVVPLAFDMLSLGDTQLLEEFIAATRQGLGETATRRLGQLLSYVQSDDAAPLRQALSELYSASPDIRMHLALHPLLNSPMVPVLEQQREGLASWLASCYEFYLEAEALQNTMESQRANSNLTKPSLMNRLQRSWASDKVASLSRDSTVHAGRFLLAMISALRGYLKDTAGVPGDWQQRRIILRRLMLFWKRTFESLVEKSFEEARFQAHLTQGSNLIQHSLSILANSGEDQKFLATVLGYLERDFVVGFKLSTGLSMEALWNRLRPDPIPNAEVLKQIVQMEYLAGQFDSLRWRVDASVANLKNVQDAMARAYAFIRTGRGDAAGLVKELEANLKTLEEKIRDADTSVSRQPFFAECFEALRQAVVLHQISRQEMLTLGSSELAVLSNMSTVSLMQIQASKQTPLQLVDCILAQTKSEAHPWAGTLAKTLLLKYDSTASANLHELYSVDVEMPIMGQALARASEAIATDPLVKTERLLLSLLQEIMAAHAEGDIISRVHTDLVNKDDVFFSVKLGNIAGWLNQAEQFQFPLDDNETTWPQHLIEIFKGHFVKALMALAAAEKGARPRAAYTSIAWVQFALGALKLYVPDKIFDPHHRAQVELDEHRQLYESLRSQLAALEMFELAFTGQRGSYRSELLVQEMNAIGEPATSSTAVQAIYRPTGGAGKELGRLQGVFNNVLNVVVQKDVAAAQLRYLADMNSTEAAEELEHVEQKLGALIGALLGPGFGAYQDLTLPLVSFLRCLAMGLSLVVVRKGDDDQEEEGGVDKNSASSLVAVTPFMSGTVFRAEENAASLPVRTLEFIEFVQALVAVEYGGVENLAPTMRHALNASFAAFHEEWSRKLEADRKLEQEKTSLFKFKGSLEDEEEFDQEEFESLFPDYQGDEDEQAEGRSIKAKKTPAKGGRELSILLAEAHEKIFLERIDGQTAIHGLVRGIARKVARDKTGSMVLEEAGMVDAQLLPATMLIYDDQDKAFKAVVDKSNFYTDANLPEVRKALRLINDIKKKFQELRSIDEIGHHQTLTDVINACDKMLEQLAIDDPLARILTGFEHLHSFVYEWQEGGWAPEKYKATALYQALREIICRWRQLELGSWSRLLDDEAKKNHDDAKSWWFIAYGAVILEPAQRLEQGEENLVEYAVKLLGILSSYFVDASLGQYAARMDLLRQLKRHLDMLILDEPRLVVIRDAVQNFIAFYARYEGKVAEAITSGRQPLDRSMKDVLLMFKWRDTNIDALRESARRSHQKLFRLVRKFRGVLGLPVSGIMNQGLPEEIVTGAGSVEEEERVEVRPDLEAVSLSQELIPSIAGHAQWSRMTNQAAVLKAMKKHGSIASGVVNVPEMLDDYLTDLVSSMTTLRKETPSTMTEEVKEIVRHLKTRKTKLYADTLKDLREMGFSRNPATTILERQSSTPLVLVGSGLIPYLQGQRDANGRSVLDAIEYFYHKTLDLVGKVRGAAIEHSDDLSREVVQRSIGYVEGVLHVMFKQRQFLAKSTLTERKLETAVGYVRNIVSSSTSSSSGDAQAVVSAQTNSTNHGRVVRWLVQILKFAVHLAEIHGKHGGVDNSAVCDKFRQWISMFEGFVTAQDQFPVLPAGFTSSAMEKLQNEIDTALANLRADLDNTSQQRPDLAFIVRQVQLWTSTRVDNIIMNGIDTTTANIEEFASSVLTLSSKVLVALQNFAKSAQQNLPQTTEDAGWLVKYHDGLEKSIDALRIKVIGTEINDVIRSLRDITGQNNQAASTLLRCVLPILEQYAATCRQNLSQYGQLHRTTCRLGYTLSNSFIQIASQGFCTPQEKSDEKSGESGNVETGTGLGDADNNDAEDISKDVGADEDLSDLAQEKNQEPNKDMKDEKDAVDMGSDDLEGEMGDVGEDEEKDDEGADSDDDGGQDDEEEEQNEEAGDVDDLDPTAVDEKMWDGSGEDDAEKDQEGDNQSGKKDEEEKMASGDDKKKKEEEKKSEEKEEEKGDGKGEENGDEDDEGELGQEEENMARDELNRNENTEEQETLNLPEDMNIDLDDEEGSGEDEDLDDLDDLEDAENPDEVEKKDGAEDSEDEQNPVEETKPNGDDLEGEISDNEEIEASGADEDVDMDKEEQEPEAEPEPEPEQEGQEQEKQEQEQQPLNDNAAAQQDNSAPSDVQNGGGLGQDEDMADDTGENQAAQKDQGDVTQQQPEKDKAPGDQGVQSNLDQDNGAADQADTADSQPFKQLGDALERWYNNQKDIQKAPDNDDEQQQQKTQPEADMARAEFQHLQDENAEADTQAIGTATEEEVKPFDDAMAIDQDETTDDPRMMMPDEDDQVNEDIDMQDVDEPQVQDQDVPTADRDDGRSGVATHQGAPDVEDDSPNQDKQTTGHEGNLSDAEDDEEVQETSQQLSNTHLLEEQQDRELVPFNEALDKWVTFQTKTHSLSLALASQLRLILTPSQATKLSGAYKTGKRLRIRSIISYIASDFKRDKIWMRRAVPTKRSYQILVCLDDSKSMRDNAAGSLALESLVMMTRSLTMLEVGQIGVLGFGEKTFVAHSLTDPGFASHDAGARVLQQFTFKQEHTNMSELLRTTIDHFKEARLRNTAGSSGSEDLWQLSLILSDGIVEKKERERLRPLLREALEQRIMCVFIMIDNARGGKGKSSVLDLREADFSSGAPGEVRFIRYLDSFPFAYFLIVHDLEELPGALAGLLRSWFAEVSK